MSAIAPKKLILGEIHLYNKTKKFETPTGKPGTRKTTPAEDRTIFWSSKRNTFLSSRGINVEIGQNVTSEISTRKIRKHLQKSGLCGCSVQKKNRLPQKKKNIRKRFQFTT